MVDFIIKNRLKGILVLSNKRGGDKIKRVANFKDWLFKRIIYELQSKNLVILQITTLMFILRILATKIS